jgi:mannitol/fructose-specific phosphotransferase system IIA component (Ntr-type)
VIGLASPQNQSQQHLTILKTIVEQFGNADFRKCCRQSNDTAALYTLLTQALVPAEYA